MSSDEGPPVVLVLTSRQAGLIAIALGFAAIGAQVTPDEALAITDQIQQAMGAAGE